MAELFQRTSRESALAFPNMRPIQVLGKDGPDFEDAALRACDLILARGPPNRQGAGRHGEPSGRGQGGGRRRGRKHVFVATTNSD